MKKGGNAPPFCYVYVFRCAYLPSTDIPCIGSLELPEFPHKPITSPVPTRSPGATVTEACFKWASMLNSP